MIIRNFVAAGAAAVIAAIGLTTAIAGPASAATSTACSTGLVVDIGGGVLLASGCHPDQGSDAPYTVEVQDELGNQAPRTFVCQTGNPLTAEGFDNAISLLSAVPFYGLVVMAKASQLRAAGPGYWGGGQCVRQ
ncbi:hypothetical protein BTM25_46870 [Actinomadura rubteroloni]|uniref:Secreted protein n=2 Tax=Actinomadura rubteroloni TaxID=1926885 RepID=A0A2P4UEQ1_9ACTN|nr:hypothetical protein BTM25_46870 [Actinomadura rubteroloni]